jgi:signal recognition particle subunit SEC65
MKKLLGIVVLGFLLSGNAYASKIGNGSIQFSDEVTKNFIKFLRNEYGISFVVTPDGSYSTYGICGVERCKGGMTTVLKWCKRDTGQKCYVFAQRKKQQKIIRWNKADYIFPKDDWNYNAMVKTEYLSSNNKGIKQNISDDQIKSVLNELGFINFNKNIIEPKEKEEVEQSIVTNETSVVPKVEKKMTKQQQIEIDQIKEMFDIGALTKDEYDVAIKRALN